MNNAIHIHELIGLSVEKSYLSMNMVRLMAAEDSARVVSNLIFKDIQNAICFYAGPFPSGEKLSFDPDLIVLPYKKTWIEFGSDDGGFRCGVFCTQVENDITCCVFERDLSKDWIYCGLIFFEVGTNKYKATTGLDKKENDLLIAYSFAALRFINLLNCTNVRRTEHKPDEKLQKARSKRGKKPLFSYWTLDLDLSRPESRDSLGGTHASPRLHLRRGHARQYAPGKYTWVQPCVVGNKALGMIHKDYAVAH